MIAVEDAQRAVLESAGPLPPGPARLADALGHVLAEDVASDIDMPPYDKALMDGYAVRSQDFPGGAGEAAVAGEIFAGQPPWPADRALVAGQAARIMTGAPIPPGTDAVVMVERTRQGSKVGGPSSAVRIDDPRLKPGQNVMGRGTEMQCGQVVLRTGTWIRPAEIGVLATVGRATVSVHPRPRVAIVSTGNEVVEAHESPGPGQIRNSNGPTLAALVTRAGGTPDYLGIARDTNDDLRRLVATGLRADMLLLSGGVSAGDLDLVPGVLRELGVREVFHKVNVKPGKPVWFGIAPFRNQQSTISNSPTLVFGLPGNPVSVMVCFELFVRPAIRRMLGLSESVPPLVSAALTEERSYRSDRPTYWPAWLDTRDAGFRVRPLPWQGSPDLRAITEANSFVLFPPGEHALRAGDCVQVLSARE
jgi:molybdopterin molybdotransferase